MNKLYKYQKFNYLNENTVKKIIEEGLLGNILGAGGVLAAATATNFGGIDVGGNEAFHNIVNDAKDFGGKMVNYSGDLVHNLAKNSPTTHKFLTHVLNGENHQGDHHFNLDISNTLHNFHNNPDPAKFFKNVNNEDLNHGKQYPSVFDKDYKGPLGHDDAKDLTLKDKILNYSTNHPLKTALGTVAGITATAGVTHLGINKLKNSSAQPTNPIDSKKNDKLKDILKK